MPQTRDLVGCGPITFEAAIKEEENVINLAAYGPATDKFYQELWAQKDSIEALVKHHLALGSQDWCSVLPSEYWIRGSFNVCIFVEVKSGNLSGNVIFRCPLPHKLAEARYAGSILEKLGSEVGAHIWVEEHCPEIRSPHLFGFGMIDNGHFTHTKHLPVFARLARHFWRSIYRLCRLPLLSHYVRNVPRVEINSAYMILEYLGPETGQMLSDTFDTYREDEARRLRLYRGMSQIMVSLARIPQRRIGSFRFNSNSTVTLTNRPLTCSMIIAENDGAIRTVQKHDTFTCTDAFVSELLTFHDQRFLSQLHAAYDESDCRSQMAVKTLLRVISHNYVKREIRHGPFFLQLTDFHASNILVDKHWNITGLIDLEWICALPSEMLSVPYWLTGCSIDGIEGKTLDQFNQARQTFMEVFEEEEQARRINGSHSITLSKVMQEMWDSKGVWFWYCLSSVNAMYFLLEPFLLPPGSFTLEAERVVSRFWSRDSEDVVQRKLAERELYETRVRKLFDE